MKGTYKVPGNFASPLVIFGIVMLLLWGLTFTAIQFNLDTWDERGSYMDAVIAVSAIFSFLALVGVVFTLLLQRQELKLQHRQMEGLIDVVTASMHVQEHMAKALSEQTGTMKNVARLNAYNSIMEFYSAQATCDIRDGKSGFCKLSHALSNLRKIEEVLEGMEREGPAQVDVGPVSTAEGQT